MRKILFCLMLPVMCFSQKARILKSWPSKAVYNVQPGDTIGLYVQFDKQLTTETVSMSWTVNNRMVYVATNTGVSTYQDSLIYVGHNTYYGVSHVRIGGANLTEGRWVSGTGFGQPLVGNSGLSPSEWLMSSPFTINITSATGLEEDYISPGIKLIALYDFQGREVAEAKPNTALIALYSDGTRRKILK